MVVPHLWRCHLLLLFPKPKTNTLHNQTRPSRLHMPQEQLALLNHDKRCAGRIVQGVLVLEPHQCRTHVRGAWWSPCHCRTGHSQPCRIMPQAVPPQHLPQQLLPPDLALLLLALHTAGQPSTHHTCKGQVRQTEQRGTLSTAGGHSVCTNGWVLLPSPPNDVQTNQIIQPPLRRGAPPVTL